MRIEGVVALVTDEFADVQQTPAAPCLQLVDAFAPVLAGVGQMPYRRFLSYNVFGGIGWVAGMTWTGYFLGSAIPDIKSHIHKVVLVVIVLSVIPIVIEVLRERRRGAA